MWYRYGTGTTVVLDFMLDISYVRTISVFKTYVWRVYVSVRRIQIYMCVRTCCHEIESTIPTYVRLLSTTYHKGVPGTGTYSSFYAPLHPNYQTKIVLHREIKPIIDRVLWITIKSFVSNIIISCKNEGETKTKVTTVMLEMDEPGNNW